METKNVRLCFKQLFKKRNVFDLIAGIGIPVTMVVADGEHVQLHEALAIINIIFCVLVLWLPEKLKKWPMIPILIVLIIAYITDGF